MHVPFFTRDTLSNTLGSFLCSLLYKRFFMYTFYELVLFNVPSYLNTLPKYGVRTNIKHKIVFYVQYKFVLPFLCNLYVPFIFKMLYVFMRILVHTY